MVRLCVPALESRQRLRQALFLGLPLASPRRHVCAQEALPKSGRPRPASSVGSIQENLQQCGRHLQQAA